MTGDELRTALRKTLVDNGVPHASVDHVVDTAVHAADEACAAMARVIGQCGDPKVAICASNIAISIAVKRMQKLSAKIVADAQRAGLPVKTATVSAGS